MIKVYGEYDYTVYFETIEVEDSSDITVHSFVNEDGLFTELSNEDITILVETDKIGAQDVDKNFIKTYYTEHVAKVNRMVKSLGTNKKIDLTEFINNVAYQLTSVVASNIKELKNDGNKSNVFGGMFK